MLKHNVRFWLLKATALGLVGVASSSALTQPGLTQNAIIPDATLGGEASQVIPFAPVPTVDLILGGAVRGQNLFHSFEQFNVGEGGGAYFITPSTDISNIFTRIIGSDPSQILGILGARQADFSSSPANLFLVNPNGILFGENSLLDVGGSFVATTADAVAFGDLGVFSSLNPLEPAALLTINPSALLFTQSPPQGITNRSTALTGFLTPSDDEVSGLRVPDGQNILFVGGDIDIEGGRLNALGGRIELGGLAEAGEVELVIIDGSYELYFPENALLADLSLSDDARVSVRGVGGGDITANFNLITASEGGRLVTGTEGAENGGDILINAQILQIDGIGVFSGLSSGIYNQATPSATGNAGDIFIETNSLILRDQGGINARTFGQGNGGRVYINSDLISLSEDSYINLESIGSGRGGDLIINGGNLLLLSGGQITAGSGRESLSGEFGSGGEVSIDIAGVIEIDDSGARFNRSGIFSETASQNPAGNIFITTGRLVVANGGAIASGAVGSGSLGGDGGNITINSFGSVEVIGRGSRPSAITTESNPREGAQRVSYAGDIFISAERLIVNGGGSVQSLATVESPAVDLGSNAGSLTLRISDAIEIEGENSYISSGVLLNAIGNGGFIDIKANSLTIENGAFINSTTSALGDAGNIDIQINDYIQLNNGQISSQVSNGGRGNAGDINISSRSLILTQGAGIATSVFRTENGLPGGIGKGGDIRINATDFVDIDGTGPGGFSSGIFANTQSGASGTGGNISVVTSALRIANGAVVTAQTLNESDSGNIDVIADTILLESGGQLVADTRSGGSAGTITLAVAGDAIISGVDPNFSNRFIQFPNVPVANVSESSGIFVPTSQNSTGDGGSILIQSGSLAILERGQISAESLGSGLAGNIEIVTNGSGLFNYGSTPVRYALLMRNGDITTQAQQSAGGDISVISLGTTPIILLEDSDIMTDSLGNGGNITLDSVVIAFDDSDILARSSDARGGNITLGPFFSDTLPVGAVFPTENNGRVDVSADGRLASGVITTPDTSFIQNSLNQLPAVVTDPSTLIAGSCIARTAEGQGTFVNTGSGGLPTSPGDGVLSSYPTGNVQYLPGTEPQAVWQPGDPILEPTEVFPLPNGRLVLARACDGN
jgi:filamentous hemagglutinin family protein